MLPPHVDADKAANEGWWQDPAYILYELPVNSTISAPGHDERVYLDTSKPYTMRGYAYSGGGRKITRVEVSFDGGAQPFSDTFAFRFEFCRVKYRPLSYDAFSSFSREAGNCNRSCNAVRQAS